MSWPSAASRRQIAAPIPRPPPVTTVSGLIVEIFADGLEVGVAGLAAPLRGDDLPAPLGHPLDLGRVAERARHRQRRRSASQSSHVSSGSSIATPSAASRSVSHL